MDLDKPMFSVNEFDKFNIRGKNQIYNPSVVVYYRSRFHYGNMIKNWGSSMHKSINSLIDYIYKENIKLFAISVDETFKETFEKVIPKEIIIESDILIIYVFDLSYLSCFNNDYSPSVDFINAISLS